MTAGAPFVMPLGSSEASLERVGGKGRALAVLARGGLPVPDGFFVTTAAYRAFVAQNGLEAAIWKALDGVGVPQPEALEQAARRVQALFEEAPLPEELATAIREGWEGRWEEAVAVRSSATAEDLPEASFAGQHESFLNVRGPAETVEAVRRCWASLWTARALGYRARHGMGPDAVAMAVVVQRLVEAEVSGVLFTAHPASGDRSELVVNASYGLGEAIVGGEVTPDGFVLDRESRAVKEARIGAKETRVVASGSQGTATRPVGEAERAVPCVSKERLAELAALGLAAEALFDGRPQDLEWALAGGCFWLLQSRPITGLPPEPLEPVHWEPPFPGAKLVRRQIVENMPDPLSPLFAELYLGDGLERAIDAWLAELDPPFDMGAIIARPLFTTANGFAYCRADYRLSWRLLGRLPRFVLWYARLLPKLMRETVPRWRDEALPAYLAVVDEWRALDPGAATDAELLAGVRVLARADAHYWFHVAMVVGVAKVSDALLNAFLTSRLVPGGVTSGVFLRGFPSRTLDAQRELEALAGRIRADPALRERVLAAPHGGVMEALEGLSGGDQVRGELGRYLEAYGHTVYTLDFAEPTQAEDPRPVLLSLQALVAEGGCDIAARQAAMTREREVQEARVAASLGPVRRWGFRKLLGWAQRYGPHREDALFSMGAAWPTTRRLALELGARLVAAGSLARADDVFYLETPELETACAARAAGRAHPGAAEKAARQRALRERRKRLHPPPMIPVGSRFEFGPFSMAAWETQRRNADDAETLEGFAVSPGRVTGPASVIRSPAEFSEMEPGTILVCPATTPAWTPLFTRATGLVTDIGGILAHGSIVAREYAIPAVMGTGNATRRIVSGQRITVDGDVGTVALERNPGTSSDATSRRS